MPLKILTVIIFLIPFLNSQVMSTEPPRLKLNSAHSFLKEKVADDSTKMTKSGVQKVNIGGLFIAPYIGVAFPLGTFGNYSNSGFLWGAKFELAYSRLYPFVFGFVYESQKNAGNGDFTTVNSLTQFDTRITSLGGSLDIILNKFIRSDFTTTIFSVEVKYAKVQRDLVPLTSLPEIAREESLLTYSAGLGFTIYVFDLSGRYTFAKDFSNLTFQMKLHLPIVRF